MGTIVKTNIFGTHPVKSANVNRKKCIFLSMTVSTNIIYLFSKIKTVGGRSFFKKPVPFSEQNTVLHFQTYHEFKFLSRFRNKYNFCNIPEFGNNQHFKPKHMFIIFEHHNFW